MSKTKLDIYTPRYVGQRFEDHSLPVELLEDVTGLRDLTIALAKHLYLSEKDGRKRVPRGFTEGVDFVLSDINQGSTIPIISILFNSLVPNQDSFIKYFEEAKEKIISVVEKADKNEAFELPGNIASYFNRIGSKLKSDEAIEFTPHELNKSRLTRESRKKIILSSSTLSDYSSEIMLRGKVIEMDKSKNTFLFELINGQKITGEFTINSKDDLQEAFNRFEENQRILIEGTGIFNRTDKILKIRDIENIQFLDPLDVPSRLEELSMLKKGWFNGEGEAMNPQAIQWFSQSFDKNFDPSLDQPYVFPTQDGNVQLEWSNSKNELTIEINLNAKTAELHSLNLNSKEEEHKNFNLSYDDSKSWLTINSLVKKINN
jgi:hypothetical protein